MDKERERTCPRCGAALPPDAQWEPLDPVEGRAPAYRNHHERPGGKPGAHKCVVYSGEGQRAGAGNLTETTAPDR